MPIDYANYHPQWRTISRLIRFQADDRCEWCGVPNGARGARDQIGRWHSESSIDGMNSVEGDMLFGEYPAMVRIVLTVHHLCDCDKRECWDPTHLVALCQKCHLNADIKTHVRNAADTRRRKRVECGQLAMLK